MLMRSIIFFSFVAASSLVQALGNTASAITTISITIPERAVLQVRLDNEQSVKITTVRYESEILSIVPDDVANRFIIRPE